MEEAMMVEISLATFDLTQSGHEKLKDTGSLLADHMLGFKETKQAVIESNAEGISRLNQYTFQEELGRGSYSIARKAVSIDSGEFVAIKVVDKSVEIEASAGWTIRKCVARTEDGD
uniref:AlNc14C87G5565 protein n=1 Tax=Albugo laibachii Nc14 TaxID=890382 RepID=F0WG34_9STRA|nr:AlNc14C87G5565 [Albugo laibachii Nc14]|eukprot:CCA20168.1 AlNc14C87G5565 [Albugo laibachii Nc14]